MLSGALSGGIAAGLTTPLDVIKTKLQVQSLTPPASGYGAAPGPAFFVQYSGFWSAVRSIATESGFAGFWLGLGPRVAMYPPSCAVSWVAYERGRESSPDSLFRGHRRNSSSVVHMNQVRE